MNQEILSKLMVEYKSLFENVWELGGGYGFRYHHGIRVMKYCQKISELPRFKYEVIINKQVVKTGEAKIADKFENLDY